MQKVTVFLRTSLFGLPGPEAHVPTGVMVVEGRVVERPSGGLLLETERMLDERGRQLSDKKLRIELPWAKIDHLWVRE